MCIFASNWKQFNASEDFASLLQETSERIWQVALEQLNSASEEPLL